MGLVAATGGDWLVMLPAWIGMIGFWVRENIGMKEKKEKKEKWRASKREEWGVPCASGSRVW